MDKKQMQITESLKTLPRTSRTRTVTDSLNRTQAQHLERIFENASTIKHTNENIAPNNIHVINRPSLLNIRSINNHKYVQKKISSLDDRIIINVCGNRYETHRTTLELYPNTLLGNEKLRKHYYDKNHKEYFFDRHRASFEAILYYYQSHGRLRRPDYVPIDIFLEEITFFQLGQEALNQIRKDENIKEVKKIHLPKNRIRRYIWATIEYPDYSLIAKIVNIISLLMIIISIITLAIETLPQYVDYDDFSCDQTLNSRKNNSYTDNTGNQTSSEVLNDCLWYFKTPFFLIQAICMGFFTLELILRIITTPSLFNFIKNLMNWIDLIAVVPFYITIGIGLSGRHNINSSSYAALRLLRIIRLVRVFKFCRVFKSIKSLRVLGTTIRQSLLDFFVMIIILTLLGFVFGAAAYYAENDSNSQAFDSILKSIYWGIITITSVGYGDIVPITPIGRIISCFCALFGTATIGMLVSVLVDRYQRVYARKLFIKEEPIDFHDDSDDENSDTDSNDIRLSNKKISQTPESIIDIDENSVKQNNNRIHFIIGYVDNENQETSHDLFEKINSIIQEKQSADDNISLNIISNNNTQKISPFNVQFHLESSLSSDDDELTEITNNCKNRGNVLKTFQRTSSIESNERLKNSEINV